MSDNNALTAVYRLTQKTREGLIRWSTPVRDARSPESSSAIEEYATSHNGENVRLFVDSRPDPLTRPGASTEHIRLQLLDATGRCIWEFPEHDSLGDLLNTVRFQVGNVDQRLQRLLW